MKLQDAFPYELVFDRLARQPSSHPPEPHEKLETCEHYMINLVTTLHKADN